MESESSELDTMPEENLSSGPADQTTVRELSEESSDDNDSGSLLLNLPDEVLTEIILLLTPRERIRLGDSCRRLRTLVFEDSKLLKNLDFSEKPELTTMIDIQQYFNNEDACQHVRRVNVRNVYCIKAGDPLNNSIGRAINLVEVNIHGTKFEDIYQLGSFLEPLQNLEKLSIDWPTNVGYDVSLCRRILERPFSKLTYLSVKLCVRDLTVFTSSLSLCQQLKELRMQTFGDNVFGIWSISWNSDIEQLKNLKIVQYNGDHAIGIKEQLVTVLPDPERWTDFQLCFAKDYLKPKRFYIEKDVEVCEELLRSEKLGDFLNTAPEENFTLKWALNPSCLLKEILIVRLTHQDSPTGNPNSLTRPAVDLTRVFRSLISDVVNCSVDPEEFYPMWDLMEPFSRGLQPVESCCLSTFLGGERHLLQVAEAKLLLKDPKYQISGLYLDHQVEKDCDVHLLVAAYPNLTELVLHSVTKNRVNLLGSSHFGSLRRCSPVHDEQDGSVDLNSSFNMLVEKTPNLRHFTLGGCAGAGYDGDYDGALLSSISDWQNLETLHIADVPCKDVQFLIEIGKQCKNLQKFYLCNNISRRFSSNKVALLQMLEYCRNLRDLTIGWFDMDQAEMFASLAKNVKLERVVARNFRPEHSGTIWISALESMIYQCEKLTTVICETEFETEDDLNEVESAVERLKTEFRRPDFQIRVTCFTRNPTSREIFVGTRTSEDFPQDEPSFD